MKRVLLTLLALLLLLLIGLPATLYWLIASESGNGVLIARVAPLIGATLTVGERHGDVTGALEWRDVHYEDAYVDVTARRLVLRWTPMALMQYRVVVQELAAEQLDVHLKPSREPARPPSGKPPLTHLPVQIDAQHVALRDFRLWLAHAGQPIVVPSAELVASWQGADLHIEKFAGEHEQVGRAEFSGDATLTETGVRVARLDVLAPVALQAKGFVGYEQGNDLQLSWQDLRWPMAGLAGAPQDAAPLVTSARGAATIKGSWTDVDFTLQAALGPQGEVSADGRWNGQLDARAQWHDLIWPMVPPADAPAPKPKADESAAGKKSGKKTGKRATAAASPRTAAKTEPPAQTPTPQATAATNAPTPSLASPTSTPTPTPSAAANPQSPTATPAPGTAPYRSARGRLAARGLPAAYAFDLDADFVAQNQAGHVATRGSGTPHSVDLETFALRAGQGLLEAAGQLAWEPKASGALKGRISHLDPGLFAPAWPGDLNGEFTVQGEADAKNAADSAALGFTVALKDSKLRNYALSFDAAGRYANKVLDLASLRLRSGDSELRASGRATEPYALQAELDSPKLAEFAPGLGGSATARARLDGRLKAPHLVVQAEATRASWHDYALDHLTLDADLDYSGVLRLDLDAREVTAGVRVQELKLNAAGTRGEHRIQLDANSVDGKLMLALTGGWDDRAQRWQGQLAESRIDVPKLAPWTLQAGAPLLLSAKQNDLGPACWNSEPGRVCVEAHQSPQATRANLQIEQLAFASFKAFFPADLDVEGSFGGSAGVELVDGVVRNLQAQIDTSAGALQYQDRRFGLQPAQLTLQDSPAGGRAAIRLPLDIGGLEGQAQFAPGSSYGERALGGTLHLDFPDLAFLAALTPEVSSISGKLAGEYTLGGTLARPQFQGEAQLTEGHVRLARPGIELTEFTARIAGTAEGEVRVDASADSGGGSLRIEGHVVNTPLAVEPVSGSPAPRKQKAAAATPDGSGAAGAGAAATGGGTTGSVAAAASPTAAPAKPNANAQAGDGPATTPSAQPPPPTVLPTENRQGLKLWVQVDGENFQVAKTPEVSVWASPSLRFTLSGDEASFKGVLRIPRADVRLKSGENTGVGPSSDQVIVDAEGKAPEPARALRLASEVRVELGKDVKLEGFGLKTSLEGAVTAVDQPGRDPVAYGEIRLVDGQYKAYGQDLKIETGKLLYSGGPVDKPGLEVRATRKPTDEVTVGIYVRGTLERPQLTLFSDPTMTQQQQLSWLLLGQPLEQSTTSRENGSMLSGAAMALGLGGGSALASSFQKGLGLDQISLGSDPGETNEQARLTVGKYLSPKIFVSYGIGLFQPGQVFKLLYDLGKGFKLSTESGTFTGGDLLYSVETR